ncbi:FAD-dependent oxidoreductase [Aspergillus ibericus CBS 121593]|uniref:FAD/NAD(P)-binding domain-containing protein n=1 Tax=Aspergillus ibericus CBS 121593 TaxID=1448316 RepID=A0A395HFG7_9EURO|nr:FAD/NAD(P)-binding domain-containing protein [Aspergillus ibericus CBS 121593]RAL06386.1 FAD/NAD(P)-binding domain-containing protein [Aspergillus ibericus CBS 121593]
MKVIIIGGDVPALVCAITCRRENVDVIVLEGDVDVEASPGIQIPPNGTCLLRQLGLDAVLEKADVLETIDFRRYTDGSVIRSMPCGEETCRVYGGSWVAIHREDLLQGLRDRARGLGVEMRQAVVREVVCETAEVILDDGERVQGDVVIEADEVRDTYQLGIDEVIYQTTISRKHLEALSNPRIDELWQRRSITAWLGPDQHVIFYPVRQGQAFVLTLYGTGSTADAQESSRGWDDRLQSILSIAPSITTSRIPSLTSPKTWTRKRMTLLGTAPCQVPAHQGQETASSLEDAVVLGTILGLLNQHAMKPDQSRPLLPEALQLYEDLRRPAATQRTQSALACRRQFQLRNGVTQQFRDWVLSGAGLTRETEVGWWKMVSSGQEGVLAGGMGLIEATRRAFEEWRQTRPASRRGSCGIGGMRRKLYAW